MLNYQSKDLLAVINDDLSAKQARIKVTELYDAKLSHLQDDSFWGANDDAAKNVTMSFTNLLADKLYQALTSLKALDSDFAGRLWLDPSTTDADTSRIDVYLAVADGNQLLLTIQDPLLDQGKLTAENLPTLQQVTATDDDDPLAYSEDELGALTVLIKGLYSADYSFQSVTETVLQPVDGLQFATKFDNIKPLEGSLKVAAAGDFSISLPLNGAAVAGYHVYDDEGHDWMDLGTDEQKDDQFSWASTTIPDELVGHNLTLQVLARSGENSPALDELFVIASNHAILMRQEAETGTYTLSLPNHQTLTVAIDTAQNQITLHYPDTDVQVMELNHQYPFLGEWLKAVLPQNRAFN